jgi:ParB family chromosome partitioning protein
MDSDLPLSPSNSVPTSESTLATTSSSPATATPPSESAAGPAGPNLETLQSVPLDLIDADDQNNDRLSLDPDQLGELANSIRAIGLVQPIRVRKNGQRFHLVAGFRRLAALKILGRQCAPAIVNPFQQAPDPTVRLAENLVRADLSPVEEAHAVQRAADELQHSPATLAARLNRSKQWVNHRLALATYPEPILHALHNRQVSLGVADELALVADPAQRTALLQAAIRNGCTTRQAQAWRTHANAYIGDSTAAPSQTSPPADPGPPPRLLKSCFACDREHDVTELSYVTICSACVARVADAKRAAARP